MNFTDLGARRLQSAAHVSTLVPLLGMGATWIAWRWRDRKRLARRARSTRMQKRSPGCERLAQQRPYKYDRLDGVVPLAPRGGGLMPLSVAAGRT